MSLLVTVAPGLQGALMDSGCIFWQGAKSHNGYGYKGVNGQTFSVHRLALESKLGRPIKSGYCACHTCDNRLCINPEHLWEGTQAENLQDAAQKGRTKTLFFPGNLPANHKLSAEQVAEIRHQLAAGATRTLLAKEYGVSRASIHKIEYHLGWKTSDSCTVVKSNHCTKKKLNDKQIDEIQTRLFKGETRCYLAQEYGVSRRLIYNIEKGLRK